jgi:UDP-N-acetylmuramoyl-L-alanyl-D-glutamate--2,6-diaminopimelate ligase
MASNSRNSKATARSLAELTAGLVDVPQGIVVTDVTLDSREASPGALFLACSGQNHHGLEFAEQAVARGARAVLYEAAGAVATRIPDFGSEIFVAGVPQLSRHVGVIADRFFGAPSKSLNIAGITGTNGKTTCAYLLAQALSLCGRPAAYSGTLGFGMPGMLNASTHTTADAVSVHRRLEQLRELGAGYVCMEVSSHALDQQRVAGVRFHTAVFTNLTRDHLDYHGTMESYAAAKALLFAWSTLVVRVINVDDAFGSRLAARPSDVRLVVTTRQPALPTDASAAVKRAEFVRATTVRAQSSGLLIRIESSWGQGELKVPLIGDFNVDNVLTVLGVLLAGDVPFADAVRALGACTPPSGRMEVFGGERGHPLAIVDYAHTPDGLEKALHAARMHCRGRLRVVFGCGGDRDAGKRPVMGAIAAERADEIVLTDDNPRTEDPERIVADIRAGIDAARPVRIEHDRIRAIRTALDASTAVDVVLIAGKGHEDYQIYGLERRPFSDQAVVREYLGERA